MEKAPRKGTTIAHIGIAVRGLDESVSFYRDVLGLPDVPLDDADGARIAGLAAGESLVDELAPNTELYVILEGRLEVCLRHTAERFTKLVLDTIGPGDCIGEYSFIDKQPASASVVALEPAKAFAVAHDAFEEVLRSDSVVGHVVYENLLRLLIERLRREIASLDLFRPIS